MSVRSRITAILIASDATTTIATLSDAFGHEWYDELNGFGRGSLSFPIGSTNAGLIQRGTFIQFRSDGTAVFTIRIAGTPRFVVVDSGEELNQVLSVTGRCWGEIFEDGTIDQARPDLIELDYGYRVWCFASHNFPNAGSWGPAQEMYEFKDLASGTTRGRITSVVDDSGTPDDVGDDVRYLFTSPVEFPWPNAYHNGDGSAPTPVYEPTYWMIADGAAEDDVGYHLFRGETTLAGVQDVTFLVTGDNLFTLYLNGTPILGDDGDVFMWLGWKEIALKLNAGTHVIALVVQNVDDPALAFNPGGGLLNVIATGVYPGETDLSLTLNLISSGADFDSAFVEDEWLGWTPGQIVPDFVSENATLGALAQYAGDTFSATLDSDGNAWDSLDPETTISQIPTFSMRIGANGGDLLGQLHDQGWVDWHFQPDTLTLDMWAAGTAGTDTGIQLLPATDIDDPTTGNLASLERGETASYANKLKVQYSEGYVWVEDAAEITAFGTAVIDRFETDARTPYEAERLGRVELARRKQSAQVSIMVTLEPRTGEVPYVDFQVGDYVDCINAAGDGFDTVRVLAISALTDEQGFAIWRLELNAPWRHAATDVEKVLRSIGGKSMGNARIPDKEA